MESNNTSEQIPGECKSCRLTARILNKDTTFESMCYLRRNAYREFQKQTAEGHANAIQILSKITNETGSVECEFPNEIAAMSIEFES